MAPTEIKFTRIHKNGLLLWPYLVLEMLMSHSLSAFIISEIKSGAARYVGETAMV